MIEIKVTIEGQAPREHRFEEPDGRTPPLTIGRDADNDLVLDSRGCSRHHAEIVAEGASLRLRDLGSTNGILFGGQVVRELPLADGVEVTIGEHRLTFALPEQAVPEGTVRLYYGSPQAVDPARSGAPAPAAPAPAAPAPVAPAPVAPAPVAPAPVAPAPVAPAPAAPAPVAPAPVAPAPVAPAPAAPAPVAPAPAAPAPVAPAPVAPAPAAPAFAPPVPGYAGHGAPAAAAEATPGPAPLYLVFGSGHQERSLKIVPGTEYILGRSPSADLVLDDRESSKRHALIYARGDRFYAVDLQSSNGTYVNGERIRDVPLSPGDEITIGQTSIRVEEQILDLIDRANLLERTSLGRPALRRGQESGGATAAPEAGPHEGGRRAAGPYLIAVLAVAAVLVLAAGYFLGRRGSETPPAAAAPGVQQPAGTSAPGAPVQVQVAPSRMRELVVDLEGSGSVEARHRVTVSAEVAARVVELSVEEGAAVARGALLLRLDDRDLRHQVDAARAAVSDEQLRLAREDYLRKERLFQDGAVVRSVYEQAKNRYLSLDSTYRSTQATISRFEEQLARTRIASPISGLATRVLVAAGELVAPGTPVATVENMDEVLVRLELADRDFVKVRRGQPAEATAAAFPGRVFRGEVTGLGSAADPVTRTFEVEARLTNADLALRPGLIVTLRIVLGRERGLVVPAEAVSDEHNGRGAVFVARDGVARRLEVGLGRRLDREVQVTEGLAEGDEVVVVGQVELVDGQAVETYR